VPQDRIVIDPKLSLFDGHAGENTVIVWLEPAGAGALLRTEEWGDGIERHFGFDSIETTLRIGGPVLRRRPASAAVRRWGR
jgi:hypothetical protein